MFILFLIFFATVLVHSDGKYIELLSNEEIQEPVARRRMGFTDNIEKSFNGELIDDQENEFIKASSIKLKDVTQMILKQETTQNRLIKEENNKDKNHIDQEPTLIDIKRRSYDESFEQSDSTKMDHVTENLIVHKRSISTDEVTTEIPNNQDAEDIKITTPFEDLTVLNSNYTQSTTFIPELIYSTTSTTSPEDLSDSDTTPESIVPIATNVTTSTETNNINISTTHITTTTKSEEVTKKPQNVLPKPKLTDSAITYITSEKKNSSKLETVKEDANVSKVSNSSEFSDSYEDYISAEDDANQNDTITLNKTVTNELTTEYVKHTTYKPKSVSSNPVFESSTIFKSSSEVKSLSELEILAKSTEDNITDSGNSHNTATKILNDTNPDNIKSNKESSIETDLASTENVQMTTPNTHKQNTKPAATLNVPAEIIPNVEEDTTYWENKPKLAQNNNAINLYNLNKISSVALKKAKNRFMRKKQTLQNEGTFKVLEDVREQLYNFAENESSCSPPPCRGYRVFEVPQDWIDSNENQTLSTSMSDAAHDDLYYMPKFNLPPNKAETINKPRPVKNAQITFKINNENKLSKRTAVIILDQDSELLKKLGIYKTSTKFKTDEFASVKFPRKNKKSKIKASGKRKPIPRILVALPNSDSDMYSFNSKKDRQRITRDLLSYNKEFDDFDTPDGHETSFSNMPRKRRVKKNKNSDVQLASYVSVLEDMIARDDKAVKEYNWLESTVQVQSALTKLLEIINYTEESKPVHPSDTQILKYAVFLHKFVTEIQTGSILGSKFKRNLNLPRKKNTEKSNEFIKEKGLINRVWLYKRTSPPDLTANEELTNLKQFLMDVQDGLYDIHNALKHIAQITKYKKQNWYQNLKDLYLTTEEKQLKQILLHITVAKLVDLIEFSCENGLEDDFVKFMQTNKKIARKTVENMLLAVKIVDDMKSKT